MELRDLRAFAAVVELGGMTRATKRLHIVQSAVSQAIKRLEQEFGEQLLERRSDGVRPTPAGVVLANGAQRILDAVDRLEDEMATHKGQPRGMVSLGVMSTIAPVLIAPLVRTMDIRLPDIRLRLKEGVAGELMEGLRLGSLDVVVTIGFVPPEDMVRVDVGQLALCVVVPAGHRLADRVTVRLDEVADEPWITFAESNPARRWLEENGRHGAFRPIVAAEIETFTQLKAFVEAGRGVALLPHEVVTLEERSRSLRSIPIEPRSLVQIGYMHRPNTTSLAVTQLCALLEEQLQLLADDSEGASGLMMGAA
jgi:LysR family transcriptional activator of glutamate synthase operon